MFNFPARVYNDVMAAIRRGKPLRGLRSVIRETSAGVVVSADVPPSDWNHPWRLHPRWVEDDKGKGNWNVTITPGFVNGANTVIGSTDLALTADPTPTLKISAFRDATGLNGHYPALFKKLGVRKPLEPAPALSGTLEQNAQVDVQLFPDQYGTRRLMAADFLLHIDHMGIRTDTFFADPTTGNLVIHSPAFTPPVNRYPYRIQTVPEYTAVQYPTMLDRMMGTMDEPNFDQLLIGTLWLLSPPDEGEETQPGPTWQPYTQHFVFWNLGYSNVNEFNYTNPQPITIHTGLAFGLLDSIGNSMLAPINDAYADVMNGLNETSMRGYFWTI